MPMHVYAVQNEETAKAIEKADKIRQEMLSALSTSLKKGDIQAVHTAAVAVAMLEMDIMAMEAGTPPAEVYKNMKAAYEALLTRNDDVRLTYDPIIVKGFEFKGFNQN